VTRTERRWLRATRPRGHSTEATGRETGPIETQSGPSFWSTTYRLQRGREERREERKTDPEFVKKRKGRSVELYLLLHGDMDYTREKMSIIFLADLKRIDYNF